jgi:hypothetical protein
MYGSVIENALVLASIRISIIIVRIAFAGDMGMGEIADKLAEYGLIRQEKSKADEQSYCNGVDCARAWLMPCRLEMPIKLYCWRLSPNVACKYLSWPLLWWISRTGFPNPLSKDYFGFLTS